MAFRMYINGREVTDPVARRVAGPFVALIALGVLGLLLLLMIPLLGIVIGGAIGLAGAGGLVLLVRAIRGGRKLARRNKEDEFTPYRIIEDDRERKQLEE